MIGYTRDVGKLIENVQNYCTVFYLVTTNHLSFAAKHANFYEMSSNDLLQSVRIFSDKMLQIVTKSIYSNCFGGSYMF